MERALAEYLVNALWQVPLLAGGAWLLLRVVRPGPQIQHATWLAVLGLAVLLPIHGMAEWMLSRLRRKPLPSFSKKVQRVATYPRTVKIISFLACVGCT